MSVLALGAKTIKRKQALSSKLSSSLCIFHLYIIVDTLFVIHPADNLSPENQSAQSGHKLVDYGLVERYISQIFDHIRRAKETTSEETPE
jgi:hypothetical protein